MVSRLGERGDQVRVKPIIICDAGHGFDPDFNFNFDGEGKRP
jgi:hypothetical protein